MPLKYSEEEREELFRERQELPKAWEDWAARGFPTKKERGMLNVLGRFRKLKWAAIVGAVVSAVKWFWPDLVLPEDFNETLVSVAMAITFFVTRESAAGIANLKSK